MSDTMLSGRRALAFAAGVVLLGSAPVLAQSFTLRPDVTQLPASDGLVARPFMLADEGATAAQGSEAAKPAAAPAEPGAKDAGGGLEFPSRTWELPPVQVVGKKPADLHEEQLIGPYAQPRWTASRRFVEVRSYVIPQNEVDFEYWVRADIARHGPTEIQQMQELEFGLPYHFQFDLYMIERTLGTQGDIYLDQAFEVRWAFADWGKIWGNPALYAEYTRKEDAPDAVEFKLLLADELAERWHWSANAVWEHETGGEMENTYELTLGLSYTVLDDRFSLGGEIKTSLNDFQGDRGDFAEEFYIGPSIQWRPIPRMHLDLAPLMGLTNDSNTAEVFCILGYEF